MKKESRPLLCLILCGLAAGSLYFTDTYITIAGFGVSASLPFLLIMILIGFLDFLVTPRLARLLLTGKQLLTLQIPILFPFFWSLLVWILTSAGLSEIRRGLVSVMYLFFGICAMAAFVYVAGENAIWWFLLSLIASNLVVMIPVIVSNGIMEFICLGAALSSGLAEFLKRLGIRITIYYGLTETAGIVSGLGDYRDGASGKIVPYMGVRLQDGELLLKGPNVMKGYYKNPEETADVLKDGWLHTGDLAKIRDGWLYILGRKKNIIILDNGENVSPEELEEKLYACPSVTECLISEKEGQITAEIYSAGENMDYEERERRINHYVRQMNQKLPTTHRITRVHIRQKELEKTATGKIKRQGKE